jgi:hypothetical protein
MKALRWLKENDDIMTGHVRDLYKYLLHVQNIPKTRYFFIQTSRICIGKGSKFSD